MEPFVIVLDAIRHQAFLKQGRVDPLLKEPLKPGDRVVVCAHCGVVFLEDTWAVVSGRDFPHGTATLPELEVEPVHFGRRAAPVSTGPNANGNEQARAATPTAVEREASNVPPQEPEAAPVWTDTPESLPTPSFAAEALRMSEIPFQLREIPFALREVRPF